MAWRIAIINRGEPAMRFIRALRDTNAERGTALKAIAFYTDPDASAPFVRLADEAVCLGAAMQSDGDTGAPAVSAYIRHDALIAALKKTRCDAVWPGWGFISEDAAFVARLETAGIAFLGPSSEAMGRLGDKIEAKKLAAQCDVPLAPWAPLTADMDDEALLSAGASVGYPLMVKASAGGGGRGIRKVDRPEDLLAAAAAVGDEVARLFGAGGVFIERCVTGARHIEVQLVVGADGTATALGVRDCSIQRRNQKVIEEAPSFILPDAIAAQLCEASARLAEMAGYRGVATAEYLFDPKTKMVTFLEVNSRLQVEHTVTEAIFGVDLVQAQIDIAQGRPWKAADTVLEPRGHAIEVRLNAEDPEQGFAPRPGQLRVLRLPTGPGIRVDSGVVEGMTIASEFDSMIAKVIAYGATRRQALARMERALKEMQVVVEDGATNKAFLLELLRQAPFLDGSADTAWLDRAMATGELAQPRHAFEALLVASIIVAQRQRHGEVHAFFAQVQNGIPQHPPTPSPITVDLLLRGTKIALRVYALGGDDYLIGVGGGLHRVRAEFTGPHSAILALDGRQHDIMFTYGRTGIGVEVDGATHSVEPASGGTIKALMPAIVVHIAVEEGERVEAGDRLLVLEAMKMEMPQFATEAGVVREILCTPNQLLTVGQPLMVIEPADLESDGASVQAQPPVVWPDAPPTPIAALYGGAAPSLRDIDAMDEADARAPIEAIAAAIRSVFLGFDADRKVIDQIVVLLGDLAAAAAFKFPERWVRVAQQVVVYADTGALFDRSLVPAGDGASAQTGFYEFCRDHHEGADAVETEFGTALSRGLARYGVRSLDSSESLRDALWRLAIGHTHGAGRERICTALLRFMPQLVEAGVRLDEISGLRTGLIRMARVADPKRGKNIADGARQAIYIIYQRRQYRLRHDGIVARLEADLDTIAQGDVASVEARIMAMANSANSLVPLLIPRIGPEHPAVAGVAEVYIRRVFAGRSVIRGETRGAPGMASMAFRVGPDQAPIVAVVVNAKEAAAACSRAAAFIKEMSPDSPIQVELMICGPNNPESIGEGVNELALFAAMDGTVWDATPTTRVTLIWVGTRGVRYRSWQRDSLTKPLVHRALVRDLHPEHARRFELDRLSEFDVSRLDTPDGICAFYGRAKSNPRDERVFVYASVRAVGDLQGPLSPGHEGMWALERAYFDGIRVLREAQTTRSVRKRMHWNRMTIYIRQPIIGGLKDINRVAHYLEGPTRKLGLEKVVVRCTLIDPSGDGMPRSLAIAIAKPTGHRLQVTIHDPTDRPVRALTDYQLNLVKARRLGYVYPYEIAKMLEGGRGHGRAPDPDMERGTFVEYDLDATGETLVPIDRPYGQNQAGVVVGIISNRTAKHPEGMARVWIAADPTKAICALAEPECRRVNAALRLAREKDLPVEWLSISAGARIAMDSGTENLDWTARVLREIIEFTQSGGVIHIIVSGVNVGAQSYWNAEATMLMHTRGLLIMTAAGSMVLTGKKALEFSGGVAAEDELGIGGFERIMGPNGQAQIFARDLGEAYARLFEHYRVSYRAPGEAGPRPMPTSDPADRSILNHAYQSNYGEGFTSVGEIFDDATNPGRKRPFAIRQVMAAVADLDGSSLERFRSMRHGETAVVWDAHIGGYPLCLIGFESRPMARRGRIPMDGPGIWTGGTLFPRSSKKVARALNAASGNRPVVVLANLSGFDGSPESLRELQLEYGAEIGRAVVNFQGPMIFVVIGRYHGGAYVVFSKALNEGLVSLALEGSYASVIGGGPAASVVFPRLVRQRAQADTRVIEANEFAAQADPGDRAKRQAAAEALFAEVLLEKQGEVAQEFDGIHTVQRAVEVGSLDAVISAERLRPEIIARLEAGVS